MLLTTAKKNSVILIIFPSKPDVHPAEWIWSPPIIQEYLWNQVNQILLLSWEKSYLSEKVSIFQLTISYFLFFHLPQLKLRPYKELRQVEQWPPTDTHALNLNIEIWQRDLADVTKLMDLKVGRLSWWAPSTSINFSKPKNSLWLESESYSRQKRRQEKFKAWEGHKLSLLTSEGEVGQRECGQPWNLSRSSPRLQKAKQWASVHSHMEQNSAKNLSEIGSRFIHKDSRKKYSPSNIYISALKDSTEKQAKDPRFWLVELWDDTWVLFWVTKVIVICYGGSRKLVQAPGNRDAPISSHPSMPEAWVMVITKQWSLVQTSSLFQAR